MIDSIEGLFICNSVATISFIEIFFQVLGEHILSLYCNPHFVGDGVVPNSCYVNILNIFIAKRSAGIFFFYVVMFPND